MLLKSLELQGFKTFPDKTTLGFGPGITAVVGPNGSGKSNISDAVRWVLGEQSARVLRCSKMEDVVFSGTPTRKAQGYAEVTVTFDNTGRKLAFDGDSVAVTRRYYRSGESEYLINKNAVRLRDIHELFMDTGLGRDGYSMIGQGRIDSIVAARSEDRREIFEEAAGISRFRYRKEESERRLNQAQENLLRLNDIFAELEARVGPLREQAEKAKQYLEYAGEKRNLEIGLWLDTLNRSGHVLREHEDKIAAAQAQYEKSGKELDGLGTQIEQNYAGMNACTAKMDQARADAAELEETAARREGDVSVLENDILHNEQNISRMEKEIEQASLSQEELQREIEQKQNEGKEKDLLIAQKDREFDDCTGRLEELRRGMEEFSGRMEESTRALAQLSAKASDAKIGAMTAASSIAEIGLRRSNVSGALAAKRKQAEELGRTANDCAEMLREADERITALTNAGKGCEMRLDSRRRRAEAARQESDRLRLETQDKLHRIQALEGLERNLEGFTQSVKAVVRAASHGELAGIHGPVSRLIRVPREYVVAVETALGGAMQNIVVGTEQDAKQAIGFLKRHDSGRATFLPLSSIRGTVLREKGLEDCPGFVGVASLLCGCDEKYTQVRDSLLGHIAVAEDLDSAVSIARRYSYRFRIVTLDGQVVNRGGSLTGGSLARNSGLLSRAAEIERMKKEAEALREKAEASAARLKTAAEEASAAEAAVVSARGELSAEREERAGISEELGRVQAELQAAEQSAAELQKEDADSEKRLSGLLEQKKQAEELSEEIGRQIEQAKQKLDQLSGSRDEQNKSIAGLSDELQEIRLAGLSAKKDREALLAAVRELENRRAGDAGRAEELKREIEKARSAVAGLKERIAALNGESQRLREDAQKKKDGVEEINARRMELERRSADLRAVEREKSAERENIGHELARLEERKAALQKEYDEIIARLWEEYELTRREAEESCPKIEDAGKAKKRLNELKGKIKALGSVNVAAVEEYKEVSERYEFLKKQIADVEKSRDELHHLIGDLTRQMRGLFVRRFEQIRKNFNGTFRDLFGGGTADLSLSDPEDVLSCGIDIFVQPPGKIVTHLESLSGGEKALVAIALYFAIMKVSPPPFCVLDEIEAALDDVNVGRFAAYLRRMNENTQFIVITHRRGTMEEADVLYGVTMQDEGVSKLLELRASEIEQKLGIKQA